MDLTTTNWSLEWKEGEGEQDTHKTQEGALRSVVWSKIYIFKIQFKNQQDSWRLGRGQREGPRAPGQLLPICVADPEKLQPGTCEAGASENTQRPDFSPTAEEQQLPLSAWGWVFLQTIPDKDRAEFPDRAEHQH